MQRITRRGGGPIVTDHNVASDSTLIWASPSSPSLAKTKTTKCLSNPRQMGLSRSLYTADYGDTFPYTGDGVLKMSLVDVRPLMEPYLATNQSFCGPFNIA